MGKKNKKKNKKNNPYGGEKGRKKNNPYGGNKGSLKVNPANYQSKPQKQAFIAQVISDGRVSKSEAKNAAALGISSDRINKGYDKSFVPGNVFSSAPSGGRGPSQIGGTQPAYTPLIIGGSASKILEPGRTPSTGNTIMIHEDTFGGQKGTGNTGEGSDDGIDVGGDDYNPFDEFANSFSAMLDAYRPQPYEPLPLPSMYSSIGQAAQSAPGVKARRSAASRRMASTLGTRGAFNRGGLRISNLNI